MVKNTELNILKLLAFTSDVNWNRYNLDRAMAMRKMEGIGNVAQLVKNLSGAGLVGILPRTTTRNISPSGNRFVSFKFNLSSISFISMSTSLSSA